MRTLVLAIMLAAPVGAPVDEPSPCRLAADLEPHASAGRPRRVPSDLTPNGELLRWDAGTGDTLQLTLIAEEPGTYAISLFAVHGPGGPVVSATIWDDSLSRNGVTAVALRNGPDPVVRAVRFDSVPLGPGRHILELSGVEPGVVRLDCVALTRTGELVVGRTGGGAGEGTPFLGIEMEGSRAGGVAIRSVIGGSAADEAGLEPGDVIVRIDGEPMDTASRVSAAILEHRPGDSIELALLRDGEPLDMVVGLGRRSETNRPRAADVIEVLDVRPGQVIADIGCGSGWLSEAIAETLGTDGLVYAVEIDESRVRSLHRRSFPGVVPVLSVPDDVSLPEGSLDTAMLHDVASHVDRSARPRFYESVARALKPRGRLVIFGPHGRARSMLDELRGYGFVPIRDEALAVLSGDDLDERLRDGIVFRHIAH